MALAQWASMSSLPERWRQTDFQTGGPQHQPEGRSQGRLFLRRLPPTIHGDRWNRHGTIARSDFEMADGPVSPVLIQEISQCQSDPPDDRGDLQDGLVPVSPLSLIHI